MNKLFLKFNVDGMKIVKVNFPPLAEGSYKFIHAKFRFSKEWEGADKFLLLSRNNQTYTTEIVDDTALIEYEAARTAGKFDMCVIGHAGDVNITTLPITVEIKSTEFAYNPAGEETRLTTDFIIASLVKIKADRDSVEHTVSELPNLINDYVASHKEELKGANGKDGYTPQKGIDYFDGADGKDGYTPIKNIDYFDGKDGKDGINGIDGKDGKDGVIPAEDLAQITENANKIALQSAEIVALQKMETDHDERIEVLEKLSNGVLWDSVTDDTEAYTKAIPKGAFGKATVNSIGGKCIVENQIVNDWRDVRQVTPANGNVTYDSNEDVLNYTVGTLGTSVYANNLIFGIFGQTQIIGTPITNTDKYCMCFDIYYPRSVQTQVYILGRTIDSSVANSNFQISLVEGWNKIAVIVPLITTTYSIRGVQIAFNTTSANGFVVGDVIKIRNVECSNLTKWYGAGNEKSATEHKAIFTKVLPCTEPTIKSICCDCVEVADTKGNVQQLTIPTETLTELQEKGYGQGVNSDVYNYLYVNDEGRKIIRKRIEKVDLGSLTWYKVNVGSDGHYRYFSQSDIFALTSAGTSMSNVLCENYNASDFYSVYLGKTDKLISLHNSSRQINIVDFSKENLNAGEFKQSMQGIYAYYELAEPIEYDVTDLLADFDNVFQAESNGSVTFKNTLGDDYKVPIPNSVSYVRNLKEV